MSQISDDSQQQDLNNFLRDIVNEHRASRRWKIGFRIIYLLLLLLIIALILNTRSNSNANSEHVAVVNLRGIILDGQHTSARYINKGLENAFQNAHSKAVILYINSGGGSPVQSSTVYDKILALRKKFPNKKIYAVCGDACASGAYYIASATDQIYANRSSVVGSIGVLMNGFGFVDTIHKLGMERRLLTAGSNKGFLDPFSPLVPSEVAHAKQMMNSLHKQFIKDVKHGRGDRLRQQTPELFSGLVWSGEHAYTLGLIDGFGDLDSVATDIIKVENTEDYTYYGDFLQRVSQNVSNQTILNLANFFGITQRGLY